jgi:hypothetical protein
MQNVTSWQLAYHTSCHPKSQRWAFHKRPGIESDQHNANSAAVDDVRKRFERRKGITTIHRIEININSLAVKKWYSNQEGIQSKAGRYKSGAPDLELLDED